MKRLIRDFRVLPIVVFAVASLLALKLIGLAVDGSFIFEPFSDRDSAKGSIAAGIETLPSARAPAKSSWAQEIFNFPETTGSSAAKAPEKPPESEKPGAINPPKGPDGKVIQIDGPRPLTPGEKAVLERLQDRRQELDARARELEIRENLLKAAEKRLEARAAEIKAVEGGNAAEVKKKEEDEAARFKSIVVMYENMKPKDAAKIFDRLDMKVLIEVASQFNPRKMADVMAQMQPDSAEKLTVELANRANVGKAAPGSELPKIEGKPNGT
ncbi:MAG: MotE family protein [Xanthobacteraceae bacterium]